MKNALVPVEPTEQMQRTVQPLVAEGMFAGGVIGIAIAAAPARGKVSREMVEKAAEALYLTDPSFDCDGERIQWDDPDYPAETDLLRKQALAVIAALGLEVEDA